MFIFSYVIQFVAELRQKRSILCKYIGTVEKALENKVCTKEKDMRQSFFT